MEKTGVWYTGISSPSILTACPFTAQTSSPAPLRITENTGPCVGSAGTMLKCTMLPSV